MPLFRVIGVRRTASSYSATVEIEASTADEAARLAADADECSEVRWERDQEEPDGIAEWQATEIAPVGSERAREVAAFRCAACNGPLDGGSGIFTIGIRDTARDLKVEVGDEVCGECYGKAA